MAIVNVNDVQFKDTVKEGVVLVDFWAPWCGPCKMIAPVLEELNGKLGDALTIAKVNVDDNPQTAGNYGVMSIPTLKLFKDGVEVGSNVGFRPLNELEAWVREQL
ncbi:MULTISPECIES: thioredoxin [unclassified Paenibacillus]|uniref:thioredoxin n=1 Tax=unclassified Paenibacillus TaxID=185978 RepID=UPI001AE65935|nr:MULTISPECIES: thioredoxin [unclassified Paenibacillus]MBP1153884.1 thioredoxin 1 [Paenibacillus sp. PvP091]MBP1170731.1 thioredoxin 1 [Paenibacillus sp. PvR098]MBP2441759.1 thioredoxin 1 [Paenibacillus sp. PvP052]